MIVDRPFETGDGIATLVETGYPDAHDVVGLDWPPASVGEAPVLAFSGLDAQSVAVKDRGSEFDLVPLGGDRAIASVTGNVG
ncbi:hypothetical protein [Halovivax gelatinilyticus]|uniref:hypothetical protein n=1 Tax=Halovivax gelatinilyticus TaxID=2961597 RepID=UPI0020CA3705|nr:hypothetical protein [Halovivax gelatinilyticus]